MIQYTEIDTVHDIAGIQMCVEYKCGKFQYMCICIIKTKVSIRQKGYQGDNDGQAAAYLSSNEVFNLKTW